jgi:hypothetical protein
MPILGPLDGVPDRLPHREARGAHSASRAALPVLGVLANERPDHNVKLGPVG